MSGGSRTMATFLYCMLKGDIHFVKT